MRIYGLNGAEIRDALIEVNKLYGGNIEFKRFDSMNIKGTAFNVTLTVKDSKGPGHRLNYRLNRRIAAACWHVHGKFIDALYDINPGAVVHTAVATYRSKADNWKDSNIGSLMEPCMFSEACDC